MNICRIPLLRLIASKVLQSASVTSEFDQDMRVKFQMLFSIGFSFCMCTSINTLLQQLVVQNTAELLWDLYGGISGILTEETAFS